MQQDNDPKQWSESTKKVSTEGYPSYGEALSEFKSQLDADALELH